MYPLVIESIAIEEGKALHLPWHQARVQRALNTACCFDLETLIASMVLPQSGLHKLRVIYTTQGELVAVETQAYQARLIKKLHLVECPSISYEHKWADRSQLDSLKQGLAGDEEIIITQRGFLCDSSYSNIALYDGKEWFTPDTCLLAGTARARLLAAGLLKPRAVHRDNLHDYKAISLINAMLDLDSITLDIGQVSHI